MATLAGDDQVASLGSSHQKEWVQAQVMSVISRITRQVTPLTNGLALAGR